MAGGVPRSRGTKRLQPWIRRPRCPPTGPSPHGPPDQVPRPTRCPLLTAGKFSSGGPHSSSRQLAPRSRAQATGRTRAHRRSKQGPTAPKPLPR
ncbi:hypothetical protein NDU88_006113 [Pleurodeles waltl]|uniref:Uncharacterized protein n=1 Tax=Pleurodeles waltl TaxID=8319 RepID=A0AAV7VPW6_PLEWA|nr:hypothetical protein NDU88_006113 [Pleurodeles waltl]